MLDKSKRFRKTLGGYDKSEKPEYNFPEATTSQISDIRKRLKKENQMLWIKIIGLSSLIIIGLVYLVFL